MHQSTIVTGPTQRLAARALTLVDVLVTIAVVTVALGALSPALARARDRSGQDVSAANLQTLALAHAMYGWDWNDRQVTWVPDEVGIATAQGNGSYQNWCSTYINSLGCPPPLLLGWEADPNPTVWGYFLGCGGYSVGNCANGQVYIPNTFFAAGNTGLPAGTFRLPNAAAFSPYVDGRFYSEAFYAPNDEATYAAAEPYFDEIAQFTQLPGSDIVRSSYALSPAAMWHPSVLDKNPLTGKWWRNPGSFFEGFVSPTVSQCVHPTLKTRMIEHHWNEGAPGPINLGIPGGQTPYVFNQGAAAAPLALWFDGSVDVLPTSAAAQDDAKVFSATRGEVGLWTRDTPLGVVGYAGESSYDGTLVSHHVLTAKGIAGRDVLDRTFEDGGAAGDGAPITRRQSATGLLPAGGPRRSPAMLAPTIQGIPFVP